jgi:hypothetical protein
MTQPLVAEPDLYEEDFLAWLERQAHLLRAGRIAEADLAHIAQELEDMGGNLRRELRSRLRVLIAHLLKWEYQPSKRTKSWARTILTQRREIETLLEQSPSLRPGLHPAMEAAYPAALELAALDTDLPVSTFPEQLPYDAAQVLAGEEQSSPPARGRRTRAARPG